MNSNTKNSPPFEGGKGVLNLFIIGPSGCGKSTQAKLIAEKYNLTHFSTGQLFRDEIAAGSGYGLEAKSYVDQGIPVPDDLTFDLLVNKLKTIDYQNFIIDGYPRLVNQGRTIEHFLKKQSQPFSLLIHLTMDFAEILRRRQAKGEDFQDDSRTDNSPEAIANRQKVLYESNINPILEYYRANKKIFEVDGNRPVEAIFEDIVKAIERIKS